MQDVIVVWFGAWETVTHDRPEIVLIVESGPLHSMSVNEMSHQPPATCSFVSLIRVIEKGGEREGANAPVPLSPASFHPESCQVPVLHAGKDR
jgi:hypothetical protein